jgi:predicted membrane-bound spermidine synthase
MSLSKEDMVALLQKAAELIDTVIQDLPDSNEIDNPFVYLVNCVGDIDEAISLMD